MVANDRHTRIRLKKGRCISCGKTLVEPTSGGESQKLTASDGAIDTGFGTSVAIWNDVIAVGSPRDSENGEEAGAVYLFERTPGPGIPTWSEVVKLTASDGVAGDWFGNSIAIDEGTIVVGADQKTLSGLNFAGAAYVFTALPSSEGTWAEITRLTVNVPFFGGRFGAAVDLDGDLIAIGGSKGPVGLSTGSIYLFERDLGGTESWGALTTVEAHDNDFEEGPTQPTLSGEYLLAGARRDTHSGPYRAGSAYLFRRDQGGPDQWGEVAKLIASDANKNDFFGQTVAIDGTTLLIGAPGDDEAGSGGSTADTGAGYIVTIDHFLLLAP